MGTVLLNCLQNDSSDWQNLNKYFDNVSIQDLLDRWVIKIDMTKTRQMDMLTFLMCLVFSLPVLQATLPERGGGTLRQHPSPEGPGSSGTGKRRTYYGTPQYVILYMGYLVL